MLKANINQDFRKGKVIHDIFAKIGWNLNSYLYLETHQSDFINRSLIILISFESKLFF